MKIDTSADDRLKDIVLTIFTLTVFAIGFVFGVLAHG